MPAILAPEATEATLIERPWGGQTLGFELQALNGGGSPRSGSSTAAARTGARGLPIGESWDFSTLAHAESQALGRPLSQLLAAPLPFLAKRIDTARALSLQIHPDDDHIGSGGMGKEEAWVILQADPDAHVFVGLREGVRGEDLQRALQRADEKPDLDHRWQSCLRRVPVRAGSIVLVPAGTVHAISGGILLAEIQQPVDRTYRFFDYGSPRQIHRDAAFSALIETATACVWSPSTGPMGGTTAIVGKHIELRPLVAGRYQLPCARIPRVLIQVSAHATLRTDADGHSCLPAGQLRLATGPQIDVEIEADGLLVVAGMAGTLSPRALDPDSSN